jgi:hypothetical protein
VNERAADAGGEESATNRAAFGAEHCTDEAWDEAKEVVHFSLEGIGGQATHKQRLLVSLLLQIGFRSRGSATNEGGSQRREEVTVFSFSFSPAFSLSADAAATAAADVSFSLGAAVVATGACAAGASAPVDI